MQYLCLIYSDEKAWEKMSVEERESLYKDYFEFTEGIRKSGVYVGGNPLEKSTTATTVRVRDGRTATTDGPYAETKEQLGGYYLIEARDLNEAIAVASRIPGARHGAIEVRPILAQMPAKTA
jgi:hypothetical protein